jgi:3-oxoadipate enol-lactonase
VATPSHVEQGSGDAAVLLLHGVGGGSGAWPAQLASLAAAGYRAVSWDMPGYGASPAIAPYDMAGLADSALALIRALRADGRTRRVAVVGHSMGGMVAQEMMLKNPELIQSLVLSGTSPAFGKPDGEWQRQFLAERVAPLDAGKTMADIAPGLVDRMMAASAPPAARAAAIALMSAVPPATYRIALTAIAGFDRRAALADIRVPTLVLAGETDPNSPPAVQKKMAERIPGAEYVCLPGLGHLANLEDPAAFDVPLLDFLARHLPARSDAKTH